MAYISSHKGQNWLLPPSIKQMIPENHICFFVEEFVDTLDFSKIDMINEGPGHPAYHPRIIIKILIQGMLSKERSSRRLSNACRENVVFMYLAERVQPSFKTICRFRVKYAQVIKDIFKETVTFASKLNLIDLSLICLDGSKIKANAGKKRFLKEEQIDQLDSIIDKMIEDDIASDEAEENISKGKEENLATIDTKNLKEIIKSFRKNENKSLLKSQCKEAKKEFENSNAQERVSLTDPSSRMSKNKRGAYELGYNTQFTVDSKNQIILANDVCSDVTDMNQLIPQIENTKQNVVLKKDTKVAADAGYNSAKNFQYLEEQCMIGYIPNQPQAQKLNGRKISANQDDYDYDWQTEEIIIGGVRLQKKYVWFDRTKNANKCLFVSEDGKVTKKLPLNFKERLRMKNRMKSDEGIRIYQMRQHIVEPVIGNIKYNLGLSEFSLRSIRNVKMELNLACIVHNLKKIWIGRMKLTNKKEGIEIIIHFYY